MMRTLSVLLVIVLMAMACTEQATAQKKEAAKKEAVKKEVVKKEVASPQVQNSIKDVLSQYVGKVTNLGTLKRVTGDYFVLEEDGNTVMHPLSTLHTIKVSKDEESGETVVELRLTARD